MLQERENLLRETWAEICEDYKLKDYDWKDLRIYENNNGCLQLKGRRGNRGVYLEESSGSRGGYWLKYVRFGKQVIIIKSIPISYKPKEAVTHLPNWIGYRDSDYKYIAAEDDPSVKILNPNRS